MRNIKSPQARRAPGSRAKDRFPVRLGLGHPASAKLPLARHQKKKKKDAAYLLQLPTYHCSCGSARWRKTRRLSLFSGRSTLRPGLEREKIKNFPCEASCEVGTCAWGSDGTESEENRDRDFRALETRHSLCHHRQSPISRAGRKFARKPAETRSCKLRWQTWRSCKVTVPPPLPAAAAAAAEGKVKVL